MKRATCGFTLLELLVSLAAAAIVVTVAVPGMTQTVKNNTRTVTINDFLADMHLARSEAIARNTRVSLCASNNDTSCGGAWTDGRIVFVDDDGDGTIGATDTILRVSARLKGITATSTDFPQFLSFRPNGRMIVNPGAQNTGEITFCDSRGADYAMAIVISRSGRPYASHHDDDGGSLAC